MLNKVPAAFGRLCVETRKQAKITLTVRQPPSGGCVLKLPVLPLGWLLRPQPPSGGCVLKPKMRSGDVPSTTSRLRAAVC